MYNSIPLHAFITEHGQMFDMFHSPYKVYQKGQPMRFGFVSAIFVI